MTLLEEVKAKIKEIEDDSRYQSGLESPALVEINAPLALIQMGFSSRMDILTWIRNNIESTDSANTAKCVCWYEGCLCPDRDKEGLCQC